MTRRTFLLIEGLPANYTVEDPRLRLKQELALGIGGWRLLDALGIQPEVCHLNEGHAAFAVLERARSFIKEQDSPLKLHWPSHERVTSSPPTLRWPPVLIVSLPT